MGVCCVEGCEVTAEGTFYFEFPTSRLLRRKWLEVIPIPGKLPLGTVVCSRHFSDQDYENVRGKVRLKRKVVPSLLLQETFQKTIIPDNKSPPSPKLPTSPIPPLSPKSPISPKPPLSPKSPRPPKSPPAPKTPPSPKPLASLKPPPSTKSPPSPKPPPSPKSPTSPKSPPSPTSPSKELDNCDSTTTSAPSPVDAEKMIDDIQKEKRRSQTKTSKKNGWSGEGGGTARSAVPSLPDPKEDIEDMITNYHIKNKVPNPALLADLVPQEVPIEETQPETIEIEDKEAEPVFIEISVDKDTNSLGQGSQDCLMLLESVQVEVDPTTLMLDQDDFDNEEEKAPDKKSDPISLLTSSDEDDVIIQEPHIDTVDVSDETDEDDVPLVKLVKKRPLKKKLVKKKMKTQEGIDKIMWGMYDFYCMKCHFTTTNSSEYNKHVAEHSKSTVLQVCPICGFTSASKTVFSIHKRIHRVEKKFKCHLCDYWARHKMSLVYHLKNHDANKGKSMRQQELRCWKCGFKSDVKTAMMDHIRICCPGDKRYKCDKCDFSAKRRNEVNRHMKLRHKTDDDCVIESVEFKPEVEVVDVSKCSDKRYKCDNCDYSSDRRSDMKRHKLRRHREVSDDEECVPEG